MDEELPDPWSWRGVGRLYANRVARVIGLLYAAFGITHAIVTHLCTVQTRFEWEELTTLGDSGPTSLHIAAVVFALLTLYGCLSEISRREKVHAKRRVSVEWKLKQLSEISASVGCYRVTGFDILRQCRLMLIDGMDAHLIMTFFMDEFRLYRPRSEHVDDCMITVTVYEQAIDDIVRIMRHMVTFGFVDLEPERFDKETKVRYYESYKLTDPAGCGAALDAHLQWQASRKVRIHA